MKAKMVASHALWPRTKDRIFELSEMAENAKLKLGKENVINATIGALMDDDGKLITFDSVYDEYKNIKNEEIAAYASIAGKDEYREAVSEICFKNHKPDAYTRVVSSPGGSGAIKLAVYNYTNKEDSILTSDWFWSPYISITEEIGRNVKTYELFDDKNEFNYNSFESEFINILEKQDNIFVILNTPAHNPTGYSISNEEWDKIINLSKEQAIKTNKRIVLFVDVAYIDFAKDDDKSREFFSKFSDLPSNLLIMVGFSMSKGFTAYGMRMGALIGISSDEDVVEEFYYSSLHSCRANWSNCNRGAMQVLENIVSDDNKLNQYMKEKNSYKDMLIKRADAFVKSSEEVGLDILPYRDGFFISIPCNNPNQICERLTDENLYLVPLKKGLRFALCSVSEQQCKLSPKIIKDILDKFE